MDNDMLRDVIAVEKEIQLNIMRAQQNADCLTKTREIELAEYIVREKASILESLRTEEERAKRDAGIRASDIVKQAEDHAERIAHSADDMLNTIAANHVRTILPG